MVIVIALYAQNVTREAYEALTASKVIQQATEIGFRTFSCQDKQNNRLISLPIKTGKVRSGLVLKYVVRTSPWMFKPPPTENELAQITERGKRLVENDVAAWHGSDAVLAYPGENDKLEFR